METFEFMECKTCEEKPGMPTLCSSCLHNRRIICLLKERVERLTYLCSSAQSILGLKGIDAGKVADLIANQNRGG